VAGVTYLVPLGLASAGAVRVGQAIGRGDSHGAGRAGWTAIAIGVVFMTCASLTFVLLPTPIIRLFSADAAVTATGVSLLAIAAAFQLFDGLQGVTTGVLRGAGDTRTAAASNLAGHWLLGLPIGYALCFGFGWGVRGLWVGLSVGLVSVAIVLVYAWSRHVHALAGAPRTSEPQPGAA
jgi:MATE family multidrug resistance protein